jgi:hypothetical protein
MGRHIVIEAGNRELRHRTWSIIAEKPIEQPIGFGGLQLFESAP